MPGLVGGLIAVAVVPGVATAQLVGIVFTLALALSSGLVAGVLIRVTGSRRLAYEDHEEFGE
jgi:ammonium transporter Rh